MCQLHRIAARYFRSKLRLSPASISDTRDGPDLRTPDTPDTTIARSVFPTSTSTCGLTDAAWRARLSLRVPRALRISIIASPLRSHTQHCFLYTPPSVYSSPQLRPIAPIIPPHRLPT
ncbi:hypothetical protein HBH79_089450 [Parastagonospora nodorum]|nr:hypothetical protein HBH99_010850 [Parastagonospora nodorum]KAH4682138.1 hypothetical protein HBH79_089450 [Parastagonospora nodorum]KAH4687377.1 hypothetical protein HBH80_008780 [Parastagonospora nodorum]KAH4837569.1 hypothetical protein HBH60_008890 [Parastagonospora nodorum]KAH4938987.1 hypothetical protein HBH74_071660 [Parastagonospora nodorum]